MSYNIVATQDEDVISWLAAQFHGCTLLVTPRRDGTQNVDIFEEGEKCVKWRAGCVLPAVVIHDAKEDEVFLVDGLSSRHSPDWRIFP